MCIAERLTESGESLWVCLHLSKGSNTHLWFVLSLKAWTFFQEPFYATNSQSNQAIENAPICGIYNVLCFCDQKKQTLVMKMLEIRSFKVGEWVTGYIPSSGHASLFARYEHIRILFALLIFVPPAKQSTMWLLVYMAFKESPSPGLKNSKAMEYRSQN